MCICYNHSYIIELIQNFEQKRIKNAYIHMYTQNIKNDSKMVKMKKNINFCNNHRKSKVSS